MAADYHQRLIMKFMLKDVSTNAAMTAHQTFVKMTNQQTAQEIVFVAESDSSDVYKFDLVGDGTMFLLPWSIFNICIYLV